MSVFFTAMAVATAFLALAVLVAAGRKAANLWFAVTLASTAVWLLVAVAYRLYDHPTGSFLLLTYRLAYTLDLVESTALLFFAISLGGRKGPSKRLALAVFACDVLLSAASWTGLLIKRVEISEGLISPGLGPLYWAFMSWIILKLAAFLALMVRLLRRSRGLERTSIALILAGFLAAIILLVIGVGIYPALSGHELPGDWICFPVVLPAALMTYAVLRYRLLDVRLSGRRMISWMMAVLLVTVPSLGLILLVRWAAGNNSTEAQAQAALLLLVLTVLLAPLIYRLTDRAATLFLFAGLYRPEELLGRISGQLDDTIDVGRGLRVALEEACREMGLISLLFSLPREEGGIRLLGCRYEPELGYVQMDGEGEEEHPLYLPRPLPLLLDKDRGCSSSGEEEEVWGHMEKEGVEVLIPCRSPSGWMGNLLVGKRVGGSPLRTLDIDLLEQLAGALAVFIETRTLTTRLMRKLEELRSSMRELAGKARLRREAAVIVSHELRTPLTSVVGFTHLLRGCWDRLDRGAIEECLASIEENTERLERILSTLEEVNRLREGRVSLRRERMGLEDLFLRVRMLLSPAENGRVDYCLPEDGAELFTDPYLVLLILRNLLSNALRFSPAESRVTFEATSADGMVEFRVSDRGPGIRPELLEEAFQPFTRLEEIDKHGAGTGLGLYAARLAAEMLGTRIEVDTEVGKGSVFSIALSCC